MYKQEREINYKDKDFLDIKDVSELEVEVR